MKDKLIKKLKTLKCPNEYMLDIKCIRNCPISQMEKCWDKAFEKYDLLVSEEDIYKHQWNDISFAFIKKEQTETPVFFIEFQEFGLKFKQPVNGFKSSYTKGELDKITKTYKEITRKKLLSLGYHMII